MFLSPKQVFTICKKEKSISNVHLGYYPDFYVNECHYLFFTSTDYILCVGVLPVDKSILKLFSFFPESRITSFE